MGCLMMMLCEEDSSEYAFIKKREKSLKKLDLLIILSNQVSQFSPTQQKSNIFKCVPLQRSKAWAFNSKGITCTYDDLITWNLFLISLIWASTIVTVAENKEKHSRSTIWLILVKDFWNDHFKSRKQQKFCLNSLFSLSLKNKSPICAYFVSLYRVCGFAKCLWLKLVKLLLPLVHDYPLLVDPRSLCDTAKELDVIFPVTCTAAEERKQVTALLCLHIYTLKHLNNKDV